MARAALCAGLFALAMIPGLADPMDTQTQSMNEWETAAAEAAEAAAASVEETLKEAEVPHMFNDSTTDSMSTNTTANTMQDAVLETIMKEVQTIFTSTLTMPGWENVEQAAETVKQIVDRVRERLNSSSSSASTNTSTAAALRGVTTDLLKEIMVQEAVIETLWAVIRDTQVRPWITNEHQALHTATTQAVTAYLSRMQDRMRYAGFTEDDISKILPRTKTCGREGPNAMYETCPERNMGRKRYGGYGGYYGGYGYPMYGRSYGYGYPYYSSGYYSYPYYSTGYYSTPYYGYGSYGGYYGGYGGYGHRHWRRLAEAETPEGPAAGAPMTQEAPMMPPPPPEAAAPGFEPTPFPLTGFGPFSRTLAETMEPAAMPPMPMAAPVDAPIGGAPLEPPLGAPLGGPMGASMMPEARSLRYRHGYRYAYPSYGYGYVRPGYGYGYGYPSYGYGYGYPLYGYYPGYSYSYPGYGYGYGYDRFSRYGYRRLEVPEPEFEPMGEPMPPAAAAAAAAAAAPKPRTAAAAEGTTGFSPFRRNSPTAAAAAAAAAAMEASTTAEEPYYEAMEQPQGAWEAVF